MKRGKLKINLIKRTIILVVIFAAISLLLINSIKKDFTKCQQDDICIMILPQGGVLNEIYSGNLCYNITNNHESQIYFVPINEKEEFDGFIESSPKGIQISFCE